MLPQKFSPATTCIVPRLGVPDAAPQAASANPASRIVNSHLILSIIIDRRNRRITGANSARVRRYRCAITQTLATLRRQPILAVYATLGVLVAGYLVLLIIRPVDQSMPLLDNWGVAIFELTLASLGLLNVARR